MVSKWAMTKTGGCAMLMRTMPGSNAPSTTPGGPIARVRNSVFTPNQLSGMCSVVSSFDHAGQDVR
jgi:hypothetical protein